MSDDATEGQDYFPLSEDTVRLHDWSHTTYVTVGIIDDKLMEGEERFNILLSDVNGTGAVIGRPNLAEVIIEDNDEGMYDNLKVIDCLSDVTGDVILFSVTFCK